MAYGEKAAGGLATADDLDAGVRASIATVDYGPAFRLGDGDDKVFFNFECLLKNGATLAYLVLQTSANGTEFGNHCAGDEKLLVGTQIESIVRPFVQVVTLADAQKLSFCLTDVYGIWARLGVYTDVLGATLRVKTVV